MTNLWQFSLTYSYPEEIPYHPKIFKLRFGLWNWLFCISDKILKVAASCLHHINLITYNLWHVQCRRFFGLNKVVLRAVMSLFDLFYCLVCGTFVAHFILPVYLGMLFSYLSFLIYSFSHKKKTLIISLWPPWSFVTNP